jgi:hypothetical protein
VRDAKCKRRTTPCTEPAWALQNSKGTGQICEKPKAAKRVESRAVLRTGHIGPITLDV